MKKSTRIRILLGIVVAAVAIAVLLPPFPQPAGYHDFADQRAFLGIPNFLDVLSNVAFLLAGGYGLVVLFRRPPGGKARFLDPAEGWPWLLVFGGSILVGLGSAWYHLVPDNPRLVWDRLPMAIVAMALTAAVIAERISVRAGTRLLLPLVAAGAASVLYWGWTESADMGDLRFYGLVIFLPLVLIPLILLLFPPKYTRGGDYVAAFGFYLAAKLFEALDSALFAAGGLMSGHTLKHLFAGVAIFWLVRMVERREVRSEFSVVPMAKRRRPKRT